MQNSTKVPEITVIGSNMMDLITYMERLPEPGETIEAPDFELGFGGKGANQAVAAALLGAEVNMVTRVGEDLFGDEVIKNFQDYGINTEKIEKIAGESSGVAPIFVDPQGENRIFIIKGANNYLTPEAVRKSEELIAESDLVLLQLEIALDSVYEAIALADHYDTTSILNPAPMNKDLQPAGLEGLDFFIPNETELAAFTGSSGLAGDDIKRSAEALLSRGIKTVIVTLGSEGSCIVDQSGERTVPAPEVEPVDTTGAGDAFIGSLAVFSQQEADLDMAVTRANQYAALSTLNRGTQKSYLSRKDFFARLNHKNWRC